MPPSGLFIGPVTCLSGYWGTISQKLSSCIEVVLQSGYWAIFAANSLLCWAQHPAPFPTVARLTVDCLPAGCSDCNMIIGFIAFVKRSALDVKFAWGPVKFDPHWIGLEKNSPLIKEEGNNKLAYKLVERHKSEMVALKTTLLLLVLIWSLANIFSSS